MVGREHELAQLETALTALDGGSSPCVALEGEAGIGKTRLLTELRELADARGHLVLSGQAAEFERDVPFSVWVDALDAYVASQGIEAGDDLAPLLPSLFRAGARGEAVAEERYRTHRAARSLLETLAGSQPLVLVLDDLHWSDAASIEMIAALLRRGPDARVMLALAFRRGQAPPRLEAALAGPSVVRLELAELDREAAAKLLGDLDPRAVAALYRDAGGNPFYLEQLARGRGAAGPAAQHQAAGVPAAVAASLAEELEALASDERALLAGA
ncbi:MAG TPA: AAA family ATPase, partial [Solirubrobacteraceae bacterium]|nr:AAA family ATPase [Solirubrobacteraceae bacterium]